MVRVVLRCGITWLIVLFVPLISINGQSIPNPDSTILTDMSLSSSQSSSLVSGDGLQTSSSLSPALPGWPGGGQPTWNGLRIGASTTSSEAVSYSSLTADSEADQYQSTYLTTDLSSSSTSLPLPNEEGSVDTAPALSPSNTGLTALPRTAARAEEDGWTDLNAFDNATSTPWCGRRMWKNSDRSAILLFDVNGYIAGLQGGIDDSSSRYPPAKIQPPMIKIENHFYVTAYFTDIVKVCGSGRSEAEFSSEGTGTVLQVQNHPTTPSTNPMIVPLDEENAPSQGWTEGKCFPGMGNHYFSNVTKDMNCDDIMPFFLMYNRERLTAFGWVFTDTFSGRFYEYPQRAGFAGFFPTPVPTCLDNVIGTSLHIYLTNHGPATGICKGVSSRSLF